MPMLIPEIVSQVMQALLPVIGESINNSTNFLAADVVPMLVDKALKDHLGSVSTPLQHDIVLLEGRVDYLELLAMGPFQSLGDAYQGMQADVKKKVGKHKMKSSTKSSESAPSVMS